MYMQNETGQDIAAAIGDITFDTSGLAKDATLQAVNSTLGEIKTAINEINTGGLVYLTDRKSSSQAVTVPTATHTTIFSLSISLGTWIINGSLVYPSDSNGYRQAYFNTDESSSASTGNSTLIIIPAVNGTITAANLTGIITVTSNSTVYFRTRQNSGSDLNVYGVINAVKIA